MTEIAAFHIQPDSVLLFDGLPYFVEDVRDVDEYDETLTCQMRRVEATGFLAAVAELRRFHFDDRVALKG